MADADRLGYLPVGLRRLGLEQLLDQLALLLERQMPAPDVCADHERGGIVTLERTVGRLDAGSDAGPVTVSSVEDLIVEQDDGLVQPVPLYVGGQCLELVSLKQGEDVGERMKGVSVRLHRCGGRRIFRDNQRSSMTIFGDPAGQGGVFIFCGHR